MAGREEMISRRLWSVACGRILIRELKGKP